MNEFGIYLKNHSEGQDYEDFIKAENKEEAVEYFYSQLARYDWPKDIIAENVFEVK